MKIRTASLALILAAGALFAGEHCDRKKGGPHGEPPCMAKGDTALCTTMKAGHELRKAVHEARREYAKAIAEKKDSAARRADLIAAMDKQNAFEKDNVDAFAKAKAEGDCCKKDKQCKKDGKKKGKGHHDKHEQCPRDEK